MTRQISEVLYTSSILSGPICAILGLDWKQVQIKAGLDLENAYSGGFLVSGDDYVLLWEALVELSGAPYIASDLGLRMAQGPAVPVLFSLSAAPDFETGLKRMARYKHLFGPMRFAVTQSKTEFKIQIIPDGLVSELPATFSSAQIVFLHAKAKSLATRAYIPSFASVPLIASERESLKEVFGVVPEFGTPTLRYAASDVQVPFVSQNDQLWAATEEDLQVQSLIMSGDSPMVHRVRASLLEAFATTDPTIAHVTARLNTSKSTLVRRLRDEGTTFQRLLDETRSELALRYLKTSALNNQQISHLLGYRDTSAFQRAFRKWTGHTPQQQRRSDQRPTDLPALLN
ncbi:MAG: AraC family transcriptional regulator [Pseudomonadota bacterium]